MSDPSRTEPRTRGPMGRGIATDYPPRRRSLAVAIAVLLIALLSSAVWWYLTLCC